MHLCTCTEQLCPFTWCLWGDEKAPKEVTKSFSVHYSALLQWMTYNPKERIVQLHTLTNIISVFLTSLNINVWGACVLSDTFRDKKNLEDGHTHTLAMWQFLVGSFQRKKAEHALVWKEESSPLSLHSPLLRCLRSCSRDWNLFVYFILFYLILWAFSAKNLHHLSRKKKKYSLFHALPLNFCLMWSLSLRIGAAGRSYCCHRSLEALPSLSRRGDRLTALGAPASGGWEQRKGVLLLLLAAKPACRWGNEASQFRF